MPASVAASGRCAGTGAIILLMTGSRTDRARKLRQSAGMATDRVWERIRAGRIDGHKFRREHPIGRYYADFACRRLRLVIEVDGGVHELDEVRERDEGRQAELEALGWTVLRFTNDVVLLEPERLVDAVRLHVSEMAIHG